MNKAMCIPGLLCLCLLLLAGNAAADGRTMLLNGKWQYGTGRHYTAVTAVPGIAADPTVMGREKTWYKREVTLPAGAWKFATLELKGARFMPEVFVNGVSVQQQAGGMAPLFFLLKGAAVAPGKTVTIEIALSSLRDVPVTDASYIPPADQWRSNVSSCLWDDVVLHVHDSTRINRVIPFVDFDKKEVTVHYDLLSLKQADSYHGQCAIEVYDQQNRMQLREQAVVNSLNGTIAFRYGKQLAAWSPAAPHVYRLRLVVSDDRNKVADACEQSFCIKKFEVRNKQFYLNNQPCKLGGGTVVWHRWVRTAEGRVLGYDTAWFTENIIKRLKAHGANYLRFHLGKPPERLLDLCDRYGLVVQYEWSFFHGMPASYESLCEQYRNWLDVAMRHPAVCLVHPYNETEGKQLDTAWAALYKLLPGYPPLVLEDRDVIHIHKYWWSLFENLGLYYDNAAQFPKAIMVDEFGGNYLDSANNVGGYKFLKESFLRFLGRGHTAATRLWLQDQASGKVAEYWRRTGAAGVAPFCILGSDDDGNNWFTGSLKKGDPKPVWNALTSAWSPLSVSMEIWDRNFTARQQVVVPLHLFNDMAKDQRCRIRVSVKDQQGNIDSDTILNVPLNAFSTKVMRVNVVLPGKPGEYMLEATLLNRPAGVHYPVVSAWDIRVLTARPAERLVKAAIATLPDEKELQQFLAGVHLPVQLYAPGKKADLLVTSAATWQKLAAGDRNTALLLQECIQQGISVLLLDAGPAYDHQLSQEELIASLQQAPKVKTPRVNEYQLFGGIRMTFTEMAEPESHIHPDKNDSALWQNLPLHYTWLWNGTRGGLIVPATDMSFSGLNEKAFLGQWKARGADTSLIKSGGSYFAYVLQGFYAFSEKAEDNKVIQALKDRVTLLAEDAPALAAAINPLTPVTTVNLTQEYAYAKQGMAENLVPLVNAGKNLTRCPVVNIDFGRGKGKLIVSQLLTAGRLDHTKENKGTLYSTRYDEVAAQFVLNMLNKLLCE